MKITDLAILFTIIIMPFALILRIQSDNLQSTAYRNMVLNRYLDTAVEDASEAMIIRGSDSNITISREKAMQAFCSTLFANFRTSDNESSKRYLMVYIPVIVLIDYDGYWVCSVEKYTNNDGEQEERMIWKPKKPYTYESEGYMYLFTLDRQVQVMDMTTNLFIEGSQQDLKGTVPGRIIQEDELFDEVRKRTIIESIKQDVNEAINSHNAYANRYGITYRFSPPSIPDGDWYRNIEDVGFLAFFQGIPVGLGGERFNSFALGAARIVRQDHYYIQQDTNGLFYYHRENCTQLTDKNEAYDSREECALEGAFPCHYCKP